jgi:hypothetical protein
MKLHGCGDTHNSALSHFRIREDQLNNEPDLFPSDARPATPAVPELSHMMHIYKVHKLGAVIRCGQADR